MRRSPVAKICWIVCLPWLLLSCRSHLPVAVGGLEVVPAETAGPKAGELALRIAFAQGGGRHLQALPTAASWNTATVFFNSATARTQAAAMSLAKGALVDNTASSLPNYAYTATATSTTSLPILRPAADYTVGVDLFATASPHGLSGFGFVTHQTLNAGNNAVTVIVNNNLDAELLAGSPDAGDYKGAFAIFNAPTGITTDGTNLYVADSYDNRIRKIDPAGNVTTLAGSGAYTATNGAASTCGFKQPSGVAIDAAHTYLYVADTDAQQIRQVRLADGHTIVWGGTGSGGYLDGVATAAKFSGPQGNVVDATGDVYVADTSNDCIRKIDPAGNVTTYAGIKGSPGHVDGLRATSRFSGPMDIAIDATGDLYVADQYNNCIRMITPAGTVSTFAGPTAPATNSGYKNGAAAGTARFHAPSGVTVDAAGNVYVADQKNHAIREVSGGVVSTLSGGTAAAANGPGRPNAGTVAGIAAQFAFPSNVTVLAGAVYATERDNHCIRKIDIATGNTSVFAGGPAPGLTDGPALSARFRSVEDTAVDASGDVYVADETNNCVHKIDTSGNVTTIGSGIAGSVDGGPTTAQFYFPTGVAVDLTGIVYVADRKNGLIRRIDLAGNVTTYAGGGYGWIDANGLSAQFRNPAGVAVDASGNVYVADESNQDIRKIDTALNVTTIAGPTGGGGHATGSNNGSAAAATFNDPYHIALDTAGNLYIAEPSNCDIRRLTPAGLVSTVAGIAGNGGFQDGPGAIAQFSQPTGIACDGGGNLHVGDSGNSMLRKIDPLGYVVSLAGQSNNEGYANGIGLGAIFSHPEGLSVDASGVLYVADRDNHVVRVIH